MRFSVDKKTSDYWDAVFKNKNEGGDGIYYFKDNIEKRQHIIGKLCLAGMRDHRILEIGTGEGVTAAALNVALLSCFKYVGTETSPYCCEMLRQRWGLDIVNTDILNLPRKSEKYSVIWAFDVLEHIPVEIRKEAYNEINNVLHDNARIFINNPDPNNPNLHDKNFDFDWNENDLAQLCIITKTKIKTLETYRVIHRSVYPDGTKQDDIKQYQWIELER